MDPLTLRIILSFIVGGAWITFSIVIAEKLGNRIGGVIIALPSTTLVSMLFIGWTKSPEFAAETASLAPFGMMANAIFMFVLIALLKQFGNKAFLLALAAWFVAAVGVEMTGSKNILVGAAAYVMITLVLFYFIEKKLGIKSVNGTDTRYTLGGLTTKAVFSGGIVAAAVIIANTVGPWWGGIFATFPAATISSMYMLNREQGADFARAVGKIILPASINIVVYVMALSIAYPAYGLVIGTIASYLVAGIAAIIIYQFMKTVK